MKKIMVLLSIVLILGLFGGCSTSNVKEDILGKWQVDKVVTGKDEKPPEVAVYYVFKNDGKVEVYKEAEKIEDGTYSIDKEKLTISSGADTTEYQYKLDADRFEFWIIVNDDAHTNVRAAKILKRVKE